MPSAEPLGIVLGREALSGVLPDCLVQAEARVAPARPTGDKCLVQEAAEQVDNLVVPHAVTWANALDRIEFEAAREQRQSREQQPLGRRQ